MIKLSLKKRSPSALALGGILDRYLLRSFMRNFALGLFCTALLYLMVDFFDRVDNLVRAGAPLGTSIRYFLYKLPLLISRVFGFSALFATLFSLGMLARTQEITAMRAGGLSLRRISVPLLLLSFVISIFAFLWSESVVPIFTSKSQYIYRTEVRKRQPKALLGARDIWMRGEGSFIRVDHFDAKKGSLDGVAIYVLNRDFSVRGLIEVPSARWNGTAWEASGGKEWVFLSGGRLTQRRLNRPLPLSETPEDFKLLAREPDEFSFFDLRKQITDLRAKGIDATEYDVDLQVKLALPLISSLLVLLAIPFALRYGPGGGIALSFGLTLLIGFGYWLLLAFSVSLGHSGALPPWVAAWLPNLSLALLGLFFYTAEE